MNLARVLDQSVEEVPPPRLNEFFPRLHPKLVVREHEERDGNKVFISVIPGGKPPLYFRMNPAQWTAVQLFNGQRSCEEVARLASQQVGFEVTTEQMQGFAEALDKEGYWYRTPQEESAVLCRKIMEERKNKLKKKTEGGGDLSAVFLGSFDPDQFLNWAVRHFDWIYSRWFTAWSLVMVGVMFYLLGSRWDVVWRDSVEFYTLTGHGISHVLVFFAIFLILGGIHEVAHGLTCKHYGGEVHRIGAMMVYMCPAIFCDVSHIWVYGGRWERIATIFAGVWSEIVLCSYASVVWWATPAGTLAHQAAYMVILSGGIFCVLLNWNPLAKMDGYLMVGEFFRIHNLKGTATYFLSSWVKKHVFYLPVTVPVYPRTRSIVFATYALLAGAYSYFMLAFFARLAYHILFFYTPQWAFVPATGIGFLIFKSRIKKLVAFMKELYVDKSALLRTHRKALLAGAAAVLALGLIPMRRERVEGEFVLEPVNRAVLRAAVGGQVTDVRAKEGQPVSKGAIVATLSEPLVNSQTARAAAAYQTASSRAINSQLRYADYARAEQLRQQSAIQYSSARDRQQRLTVYSPITGVVITPRVRDLMGTYIGAGAAIAEVADTTSMRARIYVPDQEMRKLQSVEYVSLRMKSAWSSHRGTIDSISPTSQPAGEVPGATKEYSGFDAPQYFAVNVILANQDARLRDGMTGEAKIFGRRRAIFSLVFRPLVDALARRLW